MPLTLVCARELPHSSSALQRPLGGPLPTREARQSCADQVEADGLVVVISEVGGTPPRFGPLEVALKRGIGLLHHACPRMARQKHIEYSDQPPERSAVHGFGIAHRGRVAESLVSARWPGTYHLPCAKRQDGVELALEGDAARGWGAPIHRERDGASIALDALCPRAVALTQE